MSTSGKYVDLQKRAAGTSKTRFLPAKLHSSLSQKILIFIYNLIYQHILSQMRSGGTRFKFRLGLRSQSVSHHHHVHEGLGVFPVPWSSRCSWSLHLFLDRPTFLRPFGLYCSACFRSLFVSILCTCCSHFFWYCFISFTMFCAPVFFP